MAIFEQKPEVTDVELQYARRVLKVIRALIEEGNEDLMALIRLLKEGDDG